MPTAACYFWWLCLGLILAGGPPADVFAAEIYTVDDLVAACERLDEARVIAILDCQPELATQTAVDQTPLDAAVGLNVPRQSLPIVDRLLRAGADPNLRAPGREGYSTPAGPVYYAVLQSNQKLAERLLAAGAHVNGDYHGYKLIHKAFQYGDIDVVRTLIAHGADLKHISQLWGNNVVMDAASSSNLTDELLALALTSGYGVNQPDEDGDTPLHHAVMVTNTPEAMQCLLRAGADPWLTNAKGQRPIDDLLAYNQSSRNGLLPREIFRPHRKPPRDYIPTVQCLHAVMFGWTHPWLAAAMALLSLATSGYLLRRRRRKPPTNPVKPPAWLRWLQPVAALPAARLWLALAGLAWTLGLIAFWRDPLFHLLVDNFLPVYLPMLAAYWLLFTLVFWTRNVAAMIVALLGLALQVAAFILVWIVAYDLLFEYPFPSIAMLFLVISVTGLTSIGPYLAILRANAASVRQRTAASPSSVKLAPPADEIEVAPGWDEAGPQ